MTSASSDCAKAVEPPSLVASGSARNHRQILHDSNDYPYMVAPREQVLDLAHGDRSAARHCLLGDNFC
jgi:hypothetical protein